MEPSKILTIEMGFMRGFGGLGLSTNSQSS